MCNVIRRLARVCMCACRVCMGAYKTTTLTAGLYICYIHSGGKDTKISLNQLKIDQCTQYSDVPQGGW